MKKKTIIMICLLFVISVVMLSTNNVYASSTQSSKVDTEKFEPPTLTSSDYDTAFSMASTIVYTITIIGIVVSIVGVTCLGIKYMMGSVEERAEYKKTMGPVLLGILFIFASSTIVSIIYSIASQF